MDCLHFLSEPSRPKLKTVPGDLVLVQQIRMAPIQSSAHRQVCKAGTHTRAHLRQEPVGVQVYTLKTSRRCQQTNVLRWHSTANVPNLDRTTFSNRVSGFLDNPDSSYGKHVVAFDLLGRRLKLDFTGNVKDVLSRPVHRFRYYFTVQDLRLQD